MRVPAAYELTGVLRGRDRARATSKIARAVLRAVLRPGRRARPTSCIIGIPYISPYNVNSFLNPLLVQVMALGYLFNMYRGQPLVKKGGTLIITHPCTDQFDPEHHPPYIEFFHRLLPETRDAMHARAQVRGRVRVQPGYIEMYRTRQRVPRRAPVLHVVLGRGRARAPRPRDRRRRRQRLHPEACSAGRAPARSPRRSRWRAAAPGATHRSPSCTSRRS